MEKPSRSTANENRGQNCQQFKGILKRKWGSWVSEIRMPKTRKKIWLGSYKTAEQAARAYDAALYCLRGPNAKFNFPDSVPAIPSASSLSRQQIQVAAAKYAWDEIPATSHSLRNIKNNDNKAREKPASPSRPSSVLETELASDSRQISKPQDFMGLWDSPFDGNGGLNLEKIPSIEEAWVLEFIPTWPEEQPDGYIFFDWPEEQPDGYTFFDSIDLWNC